MKKIKLLLCLVVIAISIYQCKHDANELPVPAKDTTVTPAPTGPTGPTGNTNSNAKDSVCFSEEIHPMLLSYCAKSGCHNDTTMQSGINFMTYESIISTVSGKHILQVIRDSGTMAMPPSGNLHLSAAQVDKIQTWVNQGMKKNLDCIGPCDTSTFTFSGVVFPIIQNSCLGCHNSSTGTNLSTHANVKAVADAGKLYCVITHSSGCRPMPENGNQLPYCKIRQIKKWIDAGAPNN
jgi:hypothetical protein